MNNSRSFAFGENWVAFLRNVSDTTVDKAKETLTVALGSRGLTGTTFLDVGCGSGLFSLAARLLGAEVVSMDIDPQCVACADELKRRFAEKDPHWHIEQGSVLDHDYLRHLRRFDVVYAWGVLHHTGDMWRAVENVIQLVASEGCLYVAIYNDQGSASRRWQRVKRLYSKLPTPLRLLILVPALVRVWGPTTVRDLLCLQPFHTWRTYGSARGMSPWHDFIDWVGGYPFQVAKPEEVFDFCYQRGMYLTHLKTCAGGRGCNEFVFRRTPGNIPG